MVSLLRREKYGTGEKTKCLELFNFFDHFVLKNSKTFRFTVTGEKTKDKFKDMWEEH